MTRAAARCVADVLRALATVAATPAMRAWPSWTRTGRSGRERMPSRPRCSTCSAGRVARFGPVIRGRCRTSIAGTRACASASRRCPARRIPSSTATWSPGTSWSTSRPGRWPCSTSAFSPPRGSAARRRDRRQRHEHVRPPCAGITRALTAQLARDLGTRRSAADLSGRLRGRDQQRLHRRRQRRSLCLVPGPAPAARHHRPPRPLTGGPPKCNLWLRDVGFRRRNLRATKHCRRSHGVRNHRARDLRRGVTRDRLRRGQQSRPPEGVVARRSPVEPVAGSTGEITSVTPARAGRSVPLTGRGRCSPRGCSRSAGQPGEAAVAGNSLLVTFDLARPGPDAGPATTGFREMGWEAAVLEFTYQDHSNGWDFFLPGSRRTSATRSAAAAMSTPWPSSSTTTSGPAIGDPTRRRVLHLLLGEVPARPPLSALQLPVTPPGGDQASRRLDRVGLVRARRRPGGRSATGWTRPSWPAPWPSSLRRRAWDRRGSTGQRIKRLAEAIQRAHEARAPTSTKKKTRWGGHSAPASGSPPTRGQGVRRADARSRAWPHARPTDTKGSSDATLCSSSGSCRAASTWRSPS